MQLAAAADRDSATHPGAAPACNSHSSRPHAAWPLHPPAEDQSVQYTADWVGEYPVEKLRLPQGSRPIAAAAAAPSLAAWPWYNHGLSVEARVDALLKAMTTQEKVLQLQTEPVQAVPRLGVSGEQGSCCCTRVGGPTAPLVSQRQRWYSLGAPRRLSGRCADWTLLRRRLSTSAQHCATAAELPALLPLPLSFAACSLWLVDRVPARERCFARVARGPSACRCDVCCLLA